MAELEDTRAETRRDSGQQEHGQSNDEIPEASVSVMPLKPSPGYIPLEDSPLPTTWTRSRAQTLHALIANFRVFIDYEVEDMSGYESIRKELVALLGVMNTKVETRKTTTNNSMKENHVAVDNADAENRNVKKVRPKNRLNAERRRKAAKERELRENIQQHAKSMLEARGVCDNSGTIVPEVSDGSGRDDVDGGGVQLEDVDRRIQK